MASSAACATCWTIIAISLGLSETGKGDPYKLGIVAVSFFFVFFASFAMGALGVPWLYPTEVNALAFRAKGASLAMSTNWICNFMVAEVTPPVSVIISLVLPCQADLSLFPFVIFG